MWQDLQILQHNVYAVPLGEWASEIILLLRVVTFFLRHSVECRSCGCISLVPEKTSVDASIDCVTDVQEVSSAAET